MGLESIPKVYDLLSLEKALKNSVRQTAEPKR